MADDNFIPFSGLTFEILRENRLYEATTILIDKLLSSKNLSVYGMFDASLTGLDEIRELYSDISKDGFSVIAIRNNKILAVSFNKYHKQGIREENLYVISSMMSQNEWLKSFMNSMIKMETFLNPFETFKGPSYIQMVATATLLEYEQSKLPDLLMKGTINLIKEKIDRLKRNPVAHEITEFRYMPYIPKKLSAMAISDYEKRFFIRLDFLEIDRMSYEQLGMDVSKIPKTRRSKFRRVICFSTDIETWHEPSDS